jgi:integrase
MATVNFLYRSTKENANLSLRLLYRFNETDFVFGANTQLEVSKDYWSKEHKKTKFKKTSDILESNIIQAIKEKQTKVTTELNKIENHVLKAFNSVNPDKVNKNWLQTQLDYYYNPPIETTADPIPTELIKYFDYYIDNKENYPSEVLKRKIRVVQKKVGRFQTYIGKTIFIKDVNKDFKNKFAEYCENQMYSRITTQRDFAEIKTVCIDARSRGIETSLELDKLSFKREKATNIYLTFEDLTAIENITPDKLTDSLDNAKDWLIISAYVGQRISDFMRFTDKMIRTEDGQSFLEFTQKKTKKLTTIPIHPKVLEILKKRNGMFPYAISDQKYNDYIKLVCEIAELTEIVQGSKKIETTPKSGIYRKVSKEYRKCDLVSSHIGRRSFASNFYGIIPTSHLINITNHSSEVQFLAYIGKSNKDLAKETFKYFNVKNQ